MNKYIDSSKYHEVYENQDNSLNEISISEIKAAIKKSKNNSATGLDGIHNQMLKHLPENFIEYIKSYSIKVCPTAISARTGKQ